jgi:hypothetical protein
MHRSYKNWSSVLFICTLVHSYRTDTGTSPQLHMFNINGKIESYSLWTNLHLTSLKILSFTYIKIYVRCLCRIQSMQFGFKYIYNHDDQWLPVTLESYLNLKAPVIHLRDLSDLKKTDKWDNLNCVYELKIQGININIRTVMAHAAPLSVVQSIPCSSTVQQTPYCTCF